ncbi:MAG: hypothetical protein JSS81_04835 [Acidobacteria bacterium]|nr:hypothetical protein [Acidobacteriota bacterium]
MPEKIYLKFRNETGWKFFSALVAEALACLLLFAWRGRAFGGIRTLDEQWFYDPATVFGVLKDLDAIGKLPLYAVTEITLDLVFPVVYVALFVFLIVRLFPPRAGGYLLLAPLLAGAADLAENFSIAFLAFSGNPEIRPLALAVTVFSTSKWLLVYLSLLVTLGGAAFRLSGKISRT